MALGRDDLDREYRLSLRRIAQLRQQNEELRNLVLRMKGRMMSGVQFADQELERMARVDERHATDADIHRMEPPR